MNSVIQLIYQMKEIRELVLNFNHNNGFILSLKKLF